MTIQDAKQIETAAREKVRQVWGEMPDEQIADWFSLEIVREHDWMRSLYYLRDGKLRHFLGVW